VGTNSNGGRGAGGPWSLLWFGVALFCFAAALYFSGRERQYVDETVRLRQQLEFQSAELAEWRQAPSILNATGSLEARVSGQPPDRPAARIFVQPGHGIVLIASHLPALPPEKTYQMWLVRPGEAPAAAGLFMPRADGSAIHVERNTPAAVAGVTVLVTVENAAGGTAPSAVRVLEVSVLK